MMNTSLPTAQIPATPLNTTVSGYDVWPYYPYNNTGSTGYLGQNMTTHDANVNNGLLNSNLSSLSSSGKHFMYDYENCWNRSAADMAASIYNANTNYANQFMKIQQNSPYTSPYFNTDQHNTQEAVAASNPYAYQSISNSCSNDVQFKSMAVNNMNNSDMNTNSNSGVSNAASSPLSVTSSLSSSSSSSLSAVSMPKFNSKDDSQAGKFKTDKFSHYFPMTTKPSLLLKLK